VTLLHPSAITKGLQLAVDYDLFMPTTYIGDAGRIRQVLTNLIGNAIKFTEEGHVAIRVVGLPGETGSEYRIHVTIEDTGIGIPESKLDDVFREFQQVENDRDRAHDGTGLGLAITRRLVSLMGGEVWVDSTEGVGSGFGFHLTLPSVEDDEPEQISAPPWMRRAIVLDDEGLNQSVILKQLSLMGLSPTTVSSLDDIAAENPTPQDVVFVGQRDRDDLILPAAVALRERFKMAGIFLLVSGPYNLPKGEHPFDAVLQRPVLRADMMRCLTAIGSPGAVEAVSGEEAGSDAGADVEAVMPTVEAGPAPGAGLRAMRVLAAEDNRTNRFVFQKMLKTLDIELVFAENGLEAVELFSEMRPDIVFTDISMPKMDGKEAARQIRRIEAEWRTESCPIVAITAHAMEGDEAEILAAGIDHYLCKPLKKQSLIDHILTAQPLGTRPVMADVEGAVTAPPAVTLVRGLMEKAVSAN
jgi:hypothetical protein